jgi:hypothetical protein
MRVGLYYQSQNALTLELLFFFFSAVFIPASVFCIIFDSFNAHVFAPLPTCFRPVCPAQRNLGLVSGG